MSADVKAAIAETATRAKQTLFKPDGRLVGREEHVASFTMHYIVPLVTSIQEMEALAGFLIFDTHGKTHVYRRDRGDVLLDGVDGDDFIDRVMCAAAAIILEGVGCLPDAKLRAYVCKRLIGGLAPHTKRGRGKKKTTTDYRDIVIVGRLIAPLIHRFEPTRNEATRQAGKIESACSIVTKALAIVKFHIAEKRLENIWAKYAHLYVPAK